MTSMLTTAFTQVSTYQKQRGHLTFGLNVGLAYQQSDVPSILEGYGFGLTLAKNLYYKPGAGLSVDVRGRGLYTKTYGLDYFQSSAILNNPVLNGTKELDYTKMGGGPGFVYQNNKTDHLGLSLELVMGFNKLREKTNIIFSIFGGLGLNWYNTKIDQADANGIYSPQYESLDPTASVSYKKSQLRNTILDGVYETYAEGYENGAGKLSIMPSIGVELGYQFTPKFSMGLSHLLTNTKTDLFDGQQWSNENTFTGDDDFLHYTNLYMRWLLVQKEEELKPPVIEIIKPEIDPSTTNNPNGFIKASIKHVKSIMDVKFTVNGYAEPFNFRKENFSSTFILQPGRNDIIISASNLAGVDQETVVILYEEPIIEPQPEILRPSVNIKNPPYDNFKTDNKRFVVKATIYNVYNKRDIFFTIDGREYRNFKFDSRSSTFSATINLDEGQNDIRIEARNDVGNGIDEATIILERVFQQLPSVDIYKPFEHPHYTSKRRVVLEAKVYNVASKNDIQLTINGKRSSDFTFVNEVLCANINLYGYKTIVVVKGNNRAGTASDDIVIYLDEQPEEPEIEAPVVTITSMSQPTTDPFDPDNCKSTVIAIILNVENPHDISFVLNGKKYYDFSFNPNTGVLKKTIKMEKGINEVIVKAQNEAGNAQDRSTKEGCKVIKNPPVVTITKPGKVSTTVDKPKTKINATILNIGSKRDIEFLINGKRTSYFSFNGNTKVFSATITLLEGNNTVVIKANNRDGNAEDGANIVYKKPVIEFVLPPKVVIQSPVNNSKTKSEVTRLDAEVFNITEKEDIEVFLNGRQTSDFGFNKKSHKVTAQFNLKKGKNTIRVKVKNKDGIDEKSIVVIFTPRTPKLPEVKFTEPVRLESKTKTKIAGISASVKNVTDKNSITLTINGRKNLRFSFTNNIVKANLKLDEGQNLIVISAKNADGADEDQRIIIYQVPKTPPEVKIITPKTNTRTDLVNSKVKATVNYVNLKKDVKVLVNGQIASFIFSRGLVSADVVLKKGENTITVKASNNDGSDDATIVITFVPPLPKPTVKFSNPRRSGTVVEQNKKTIEAIVKNVKTSRDITVKVNGKLLRVFNFNPKTNKLSAIVTLVKGTNNLTIGARNASGTASANTTVVYKKTVIQINPPKVNITSVSDPTIDPFNPDKAKSTIIAKMENITAKNQISFTVNGKSNNSFLFDTNTQMFHATINLTKGDTKIKINVENPDGAHEASRTITF